MSRDHECPHEHVLIDGFGGHICKECYADWCDHSGPPRADGHTCCGMCNRWCAPCDVDEGVTHV